MQLELELVRQFQEKLGHPVSDAPSHCNSATINDRFRLLMEETTEYRAASTHEDRLDALVDLAYVLAGTIQAHGYAEIFSTAFERVHTANMLKEPGQKSTRPGMKHDATKPEGWQPPVLRDLFYE